MPTNKADVYPFSHFIQRMFTFKVILGPDQEILTMNPSGVY